MKSKSRTQHRSSYNWLRMTDIRVWRNERINIRITIWLTLPLMHTTLSSQAKILTDWDCAVSFKTISLLPLWFDYCNHGLRLPNGEQQSNVPQPTGSGWVQSWGSWRFALLFFGFVAFPNGFYVPLSFFEASSTKKICVSTCFPTLFMSCSKNVWVYCIAVAFGYKYFCGGGERSTESATKGGSSSSSLLL